MCYGSAKNQRALVEAGGVEALVAVLKADPESVTAQKVTNTATPGWHASRDAYIFHIWDMAKNPPELHVRTVKQVAPHIPTDNEKGVWKNAEVPLGI